MAAEGSAVFRAIADFAALRREAKAASRDLKDIRSSARDTDIALGDLEKSSDGASKNLRNVGKSSDDADKGLKKVLASAREFAKLKAKATLNVDAGKAKAEIRQLKDDLAGFRVTKLQIDADTARAKAELNQVEGELTRLRAQPTTAEVKGKITDAEEKITLLKARLAGLRDTRMRVDADTARARAQLAGVQRQADQLDRKRINIKADVDTSKLRTLGTVIGAIAAAAALIGPVIGVVAALAGGLFSLVSAAAPAVGALAAVAAQALALAQAVGVAAIALSGVGKAVKALQTRQAAAGGSAASSAKQQQASADAIAGAERQVQRASEQRTRTQITGDQQVSAARRALASAIDAANARVTASERNVTDAVKAEQRARDDLNQAYEEARQRLADLQDQLTGGAIDEESAAIRVERARNELIAAQQAGASGLDLREAKNNYDQAVQGLTEVQHRNQQLAKEQQKAAASGVEGDQAVIDAHARLDDATQQVSDAEAQLTQDRKDSAAQIAEARISLAEAEQSAAWANEDAQQAVDDALREQARAYRDAAAAADTAGGAAADAFDQASPAAQRFARFIVDEVIPALHKIRDAVQERALPKFEEAIRTVLPLTDLFASKLGDTADILGNVAIQGAKMISSGPWTRDFATMLDANNRMIGAAGTASLNWADALRNIGVSALPLAERLTNLILKGSETAKAFFEAKRQSGEMAAFFDKAGNVVEQLLRILGNLFVSLFNLGKAAAPAGQILLDSFEAATRKLREFTGSADGQTKIHDYFMSIVPVVQETGRLINELFMFFVRLGNNDSLAPLIAKVRTELLPALERLITTLQTGVGPQLVALATHIADIITQLGGGALTGFLAVLNGIATALAWILSIPGVGPALGMILTLAGAAAALGIVAGWMGAIGTALGLLVPLLEAFVFLLLALLTPAGLVVLAVAAIAFAIYEIITHWDTVKKWLGEFFGWIGDTAKTAWEYLAFIFGGAAPPDAVKAMGESIKTTFTDMTAWCNQKSDELWAWASSKTDEGKAYISGKVSELGTNIKTLLGEAYDAAKQITGDAWTIMTGTTDEKAAAIRDILGTIDRALGTDFTGAWDRASGAVTGAANAIRNAVQSAIDYVIGKIHELEAAWDRIKAKVSSGISTAASYILPGYATGGLVGGTGQGDTEVIRATPGEWVVPKDITSRYLPFLKAITYGSSRATSDLITPVDTRLIQDRLIGTPGLDQLAGVRQMLANPQGSSSSTVNNVGDQIDRAMSIVTNVYNPIAEPASDSVASRMRDLSLMGAFS